MKFILKQFCVLFLILLVSISCGKQEVSSDKNLSSSLDEFSIYSIDIESKATPIFDLIENVEIMRLEETDEALLSGVGGIWKYGDKFVFQGKDGDVFIYDQTGGFTRKINRRGDGPEEYSGIGSFWVEGEQLFIYDVSAKSLHRYDLSGNYLDEIKIEYWARHVYPYAGGLVLDMSFRYVEDSLRYNVFLLDENQEKLKMLNKNTRKSAPIAMSTTLNSFIPYGEGLLYKEMFSDTVFYIKENEIVPLLKIDFGDKYLWDDEFQSDQVAFSEMQKGKKVWSMNPRIGKEKIYFNYSTSFNDFGRMLIDRKTGIIKNISIKKNQEENYSLGAQMWQGNRLLCSLSSDDVADFIKELNDDQWRFKEGTSLEEIESSENPVLMWVKFKTDLSH